MKFLKAFENFSQLDYDYIQQQMKEFYGWGDLSWWAHIEDFEDSIYYSGTMDNDTYVEEFND